MGGIDGELKDEIFHYFTFDHRCDDSNSSVVDDDGITYSYHW